MSTWHQRRSSVRFPAASNSFAVWNDPPEQPASIMVGFTTEQEAQDYIDRCEGYRPGTGQYMRIIPPGR